MSTLQVVEVEPHDERAAAAWQEVVAAAQRHEVGDRATPGSLREVLALLREPDKSRRVVFLNGLVDGEVVAAGRLVLRQLDNVESAEIDVCVRPDVRRRGLGAQLLAHVEAMARAEGRTRFEGQVRWLHDAPADGTGAPGVEFARAHGYTVGLAEVQRELTLPVDDRLLDRLATEAAEKHAGYELRAWSGPVPDELVRGWLDLSTTLMTEAPAGEMGWEPESADVEAHRMVEAVQAKQGRTSWHAVALDRSGTVVAYSQLGVPGDAQAGAHIFQWGTLVHRDHRGHRLGLAVKVANLRALQAGQDVTGRRVVTWNAEVNDHMIAINEQMGFVAAARTCELLKRIDPS